MGLGEDEGDDAITLFGFDIAAVLPFVAVGFAAQMVDGAIGMAFGVLSNTLLVSVLGVPPAQASARVHLVELFTTLTSGTAHALHGNVDWRLFGRLALPGMIGAAAGAYLLTSIDASVARPFVLGYLVVIGLVLFVRAGRRSENDRAKVVAPLGLAGGFLDAAGGGGWGPVVTSNLLVQGGAPRTTIGSVNTAEFLVTATASVVFIAQLGLAAFTLATVGLLIGGVLAAPLAAMLTRRIEQTTLIRLVGVVLVATSAFSLWKLLA